MLMDAADDDDDDDDAQAAVTNQSPCARHTEQQLTAPPRYTPSGLTG